MPPKIVKKPGAGGGQPAECGGASACAGAGADMKFVKSMGAKTEPTSVPPITEAQIIALNEQAQEIISKEPDEIKHAKAAAMRLAGQMRGECYSSADGIMPRRNLTANVFPFYIGRLNPPHKFHLISLFTTIFIARQYGTKALFMLGAGGGPNADNPLEDKLKWQFINEKLSSFGFVPDIDYEIIRLRHYMTILKEFISRQPLICGQPIRVYQIGGDKPEYKPESGYVLDVDKFDFSEISPINGAGDTATYHQVVIESGDSMVEVIDETGRPKVGVMSASLLRKTACICSNLYPHDEDSAFKCWVSYFTPMYNDDDTSLAIFRQIIQRSCGGKSKSKGGGGSRRKRTIRKLRNKKTIRRNYSTRGRGRGSLHRVRRDRSRRR
jgi:hypothetical protein